MCWSCFGPIFDNRMEISATAASTNGFWHRLSVYFSKFVAIPSPYSIWCFDCKEQSTVSFWSTRPCLHWSVQNSDTGTRFSCVFCMTYSLSKIVWNRLSKRLEVYHDFQSWWRAMSGLWAIMMSFRIHYNQMRNHDDWGDTHECGHNRICFSRIRLPIA